MSSTANQDEGLEVSSEGVSVRKHRAGDAFPVPTVRFEITSTRDDPATVTIAERIPDGFSMDTIGFHAEYESDNWTAYQNRRIEFQRQIHPDETVVTLYGVRTDDPSDIEAFMGPPRVTVSTTSTPASPNGGDRGLDTTPDAGGAAEVGDGSVAERLADELREGAVDEADRTAIREELGLDLSASTEAQLRHLQTRVEDAIAYAEPVESFLEAGGPERVDDVADEMDELRDEVRDLDRSVQSLAEDLAELPETMTTDASHDEDLEDELAAVHDRLDDMHDRLTALDDDLDDLQDWREQLMNIFGGRE